MLLRDHLERDPLAASLLALLGHRGAARAVAAMVERRHVTSGPGASLPTLGGAITHGFLAELRLASGSATVAAVASAYGYGSEAAFSRAFLRRHGFRPGAVKGRSWRGGCG